MRTRRPQFTARLGYLAVAAAALALAGCSSASTSGTGHAIGGPATSTAAPAGSSSASGGFHTPSPSSSAPGSRSPSSAQAPSTHPVPAQPLRTVTASGPDGRSYVLEIWADVQDDACSGHAYGVPIIHFLATHACRGLSRQLITTTVNGRAVGMAVSSTSFPGTAADPYSVTAAFRKLVTENGTGNFDDLLRDGYRLPSGPTSVPSPDAFNTVGQDSGVTVYDMWYLEGPTPENDPALITMSQDIYLQF